MFVPTDDTALPATSLQLPSDDRILQACRKEFKSSFNLHPFKFNHTLHRSGLFEIPRIVELAKRMIDKNGDYCALNCVFHTKLDKDFAASWTGFSHEAGHGFHGKLDSDFAPSWTVSS
ncbi:MAG: hypothetical protein QOD67_744 [Caballeronia sp.]|nr:hypothetical protein [Caballeronia sp.]